MPKLWALFAAAFILFIIFLAFGPLLSDRSQRNPDLQDRLLLELQTKLFNERIEESSVKKILSESSEKKLVFSFWASWCGPCVHELPLIQKSFEALKQKGISVLLVNEDPGPVAKVQAEMKAWKIQRNLIFDGFYDENSLLLAELGITTLPFHVGIEAGRVRWAIEGEIDWSPESVEKRFK